jgi:hypothetical protein
VPEVSLEFIAQQLDRLIASDARRQDDMNVMIAMVQRLDGTVQGLVREVQAVHSQIARMNDRVRKLEDAR